MASERNSRSVWWRVAEAAEGQLGIVTRQQLREAGLSDAGITHAASIGRLHSVFPTVFSVGHAHVEAHARLLAATLACGPGSVVSHGTAAWLLGLWSWCPEDIDVIAPVECGRKVTGVRRRFVPPPSEDHSWIREGVPTTSASRTIIDLAGIVKSGRLSQAVEQAAVLRMLNVPEIEDILAGPRRRGAARLRHVLDSWRHHAPDIRLRSRMEAMLLSMLSSRRLAIPECNARVRLEGEEYEVDFLWPAERLVVETDGARFHDNPAAGARDSHRTRSLVAADYYVLRLGWEELRDRPELTMSKLGRLLSSRRSAVPFVD